MNPHDCDTSDRDALPAAIREALHADARAKLERIIAGPRIRVQFDNLTAEWNGVYFEVVHDDANPS